METTRGASRKPQHSWIRLEEGEPGDKLGLGSPETNWGWGAPGGPQVPSCSP